jgi:hypothetical protein
MKVAILIIIVIRFKWIIQKIFQVWKQGIITIIIYLHNFEEDMKNDYLFFYLFI